MLWTDGDFVTTADLTSLDAEVPAVAAADDITLQDATGNGNGIIHRAIEEAGDRLMSFLQIFGGYLSSGSVSATHHMAVMSIGTSAVNRPKVLLGQIVVTGANARVWTPIKRWVAYRALHVLYRDASSRTSNDRYKDKSTNYLKLANGLHWDSLRAAGVPVTLTPLPCPGALWEPDAGIWGPGNVTLVDGTGVGTLAGNYDVVVTYTGIGQGSPVESAPSARVTVTLEADKLAKVDITSLITPTGKQHPSTIPLALVPYVQATGWNVYMGPVGGVLRLQTPQPLAVSVKSFTFTADPATDTAAVGTGQYADRFITLPMGMIQLG